MQKFKILSGGGKVVPRFQLGSTFNNLTTYGGGLSIPGGISDPNRIYNNEIASTTQLGNAINKNKKFNLKNFLGGGLTGGADGLTPGANLSQAGLGVAGAITGAMTAQGNVSEQQMQRADSIVDGVSSAISLVPGFGKAVGAGLQLVNKLGGMFVKQPKWMQNYNTNQNVMQNSAAFGGVADAARDAESTKSTFDKSGLFGKLVGKRANNQSRFEKAITSQRATQGVLDESTEAKENMLSSADMFNTRNLVNQSGIFNNWNRGGILFGRKGLKFQQDGLMIYKEGKSKKKPKTIMPDYHQTVIRSGIKKAKYGTLLLNGGIKTLIEQTKEAASKHQFGGSLSVAKVTGSKGGRPSTIKTTSDMVNKSDVNTSTKLPTNRNLTSDERGHWNNFVDFVDTKGYKGSPELDRKDQNLSRQLWDEFSASSGINKGYDEFIPVVQHNISEYRNRAIDNIKSGKMKLSNFTPEQLNSPDFDWDNNFMAGLSGIDGWAGSRTTSWKFPKETVASKENPDKVVKKEGKPVLNRTYQYRKDGGKLNVIVGGELHARKHNLKDLEDLTDASITTKGVPVIVKEDGGKITQAAEVEREELILHLELTKKIEALMLEGTDEAAIEAGKLLAEELTNNIKDNAGVVEKLENDGNN